MSDISDDLGAFVPGQIFRIAGRAGGPLSGLTFAAKDLFDVAGPSDRRRQPGLGAGPIRCRSGMPGRCRRCSTPAPN